MPRGDGTGPFGQRPMTGRGAGFCAGFGMPGLANPIPGGAAAVGRGGFYRRGGCGGGRGWRHMFYATDLTGWQRAAMGIFSPAAMTPLPKEAQLAMLRFQADTMEKALSAIRERIQQIEQEGPAA